jgi:hypothetical protein
MSINGEYAGHVELECINRFNPNNTFHVYRSNDNIFVLFPCKNTNNTKQKQKYNE